MKKTPSCPTAQRCYQLETIKGTTPACECNPNDTMTDTGEGEDISRPDHKNKSPK